MASQLEQGPSTLSKVNGLATIKPISFGGLDGADTKEIRPFQRDGCYRQTPLLGVHYLVEHKLGLVGQYFYRDFTHPIGLPNDMCFVNL